MSRPDPSSISPALSPEEGVAATIPDRELVEALPSLEREILNAIHELAYGVVEVVVHNHRITEIRQTRRTRVG